VRFSYEGAQASQPLSWSASPSLDSPSATAQPHTTEQLSLCPRLSLLHEPCSYYLGWPTPVPASRSRAQGTAGCRLDTTPAPSRLTSTLLASARSRSDQRCATLLRAERPETPPQPSCFVPFRRDADFVDRGTLLDQIRERCSAPASRIALVGLGGVG
jgi:hypothetical protein